MPITWFAWILQGDEWKTACYTPLGQVVDVVVDCKPQAAELIHLNLSLVKEVAGQARLSHLRGQGWVQAPAGH